MNELALSLWVSLHVREPDATSELAIPGYRRQWCALRDGVAEVTFPEYTASGLATVTHAGIHPTERGAMAFSMRLLPHVELGVGVTAHVKICTDADETFDVVVARATPPELDGLFAMQEERMLAAPDDRIEFERARLIAIRDRARLS